MHGTIESHLNPCTETASVSREVTIRNYGSMQKKIRLPSKTAMSIRESAKISDIVAKVQGFIHVDDFFTFEKFDKSAVVFSSDAVTASFLTLCGKN